MSQQQISEFKSKQGLGRILAATRYSAAGLTFAWRSEHAFRQEVLVVLPAAIVAMLLPLAALERLALVAVLVMVLVVELINSAIEAVVDRISLERHPLSKSAKDLGSAAVALSVMLAALTWGVLTAPLLLP